MHFPRSSPGSGSAPPRYPGTFLLAFKEAVSSLNWRTQRWLGMAVECLDSQGKEQVVGLENLFRRVRGEERSSWPQLIAGFLETVSSEQIDQTSPDLATITDKLLVRIGPPFPKNQEQQKVWYQPLVDHFLGITLVVDYPNCMIYVTEQMVTNSGQAGEIWLTQALANLRARTAADCFTVLHEESSLTQCTVGDAYDSSRALLLDQLLPEPAKHGHFVIVPARDLFLFMPVNEVTLNQVPALKALAQKNYQTTPYPITAEVFWVQQGAWHHFPLELRGDTVSVQPPEAFLEVLKELVPEPLNEPEENPPS